jgi:hypothetical protein
VIEKRKDGYLEDLEENLMFASPGINTFSWSSTSVFMDSLPFGLYNGLCLADIVAQNVIFSTNCECADS